MRRQIWWIGGGCGLILAAMGMIWSVYNSQAPRRGHELGRPASPSPSPIPHPFSIAGLRAYHYDQTGPVTPVRPASGVAEADSQLVSYRSDGYTLYALESRPSGTVPAGGWPVIILCHGYINPSEYRTEGPEYAEFISRLVQAGFVVLKPDYRGHGQSQGQPGGGHFGPEYTHDILNLMQAVRQTGGLNGRRIGLVGHSLGGHLVLRTIVVSREVKASAMLAGVVGSLDDLFYNWRRAPGLGPPPGIVPSFRQQLVAQYGEPKTNPEFWRTASAINYVDAVSGPVQLHHSEDDSDVPKLFSDHLAAALDQAGKPVEYYTYPGDDHQFIAARVLVLERLVEFLRQHV